ncbi:hypothetical protein IMZ48_07200 [Candidatus Bathyarchaeota archaeon]|nr:hypothetical protein [Candidatus Bathyarchaeota archaeon]
MRDAKMDRQSIIETNRSLRTIKNVCPFRLKPPEPFRSGPGSHPTRHRR